MIDPKTVDQLEQASIAERLHLIEILLQSLKKDMQREPANEPSRAETFKVRKFSLGGKSTWIASEKTRTPY